MEQKNELEVLLAAFKESKDNKDLAKFMECIEKSEVIVPANPPKGLEKQLQEAARAGRQFSFPKGVNPVPCLIKKPDGKPCFPIFTSKEQIPKDKLPPILMGMPFKTVIGLMKNAPDGPKEILINPFTDGVMLADKMVELAAKRFEAMDKAKTVVLTEKQIHHIVHEKVAYGSLPQTFFADPAGAHAKLKEEQEKLLSSLYRAAYPQGKRSPYSSDDFSIMTLQVNDHLLISRIDLPGKNIDPGVALRAYVVWRDRTDILYYAIEKGAEGNRLVTVTKDGKKEDIGDAPGNGSEIETIMEIASAE